jgi:hypothetical protein
MEHPRRGTGRAGQAEQVAAALEGHRTGGEGDADGWQRNASAAGSRSGCPHGVRQVGGREGGRVVDHARLAVGHPDALPDDHGDQECDDGPDRQATDDPQHPRLPVIDSGFGECDHPVTMLHAASGYG